MTRKASIERSTAETNISLKLDLDGSGGLKGSTEMGFFDHMLHQWAKHGGFDLEVSAKGDLDVDAHHTVEDLGICLGKAIKESLRDKKGICRFGQAMVPMDEALALAVVDFSGRGFLAMEATIPTEKVGDFDTELVEEFLRALAINGELTLHVRTLAGKNSHHIIEAIFKAIGRCMRQGVAQDSKLTGVPSTKGLL